MSFLHRDSPGLLDTVVSDFWMGRLHGILSDMVSLGDPALIAEFLAEFITDGFLRSGGTRLGSWACVADAVEATLGLASSGNKIHRPIGTKGKIGEV